MIATVTITLKELEDLKKELKQSEEEALKYKHQKEFHIVFDCDIYDSKSIKRICNYRVMTYGDINLLKKADNWNELQSLVKESFDELLAESEILNFYNKFPNWIHKLFKTKKL
jgi:hypothetical protein